MEKIILYSTGCPRCHVLKAKLAACEIPYDEENNVDVMLALGLTEVPALKVGDQLLGFMDAVKWLNRQ